MVDSTFNSIYKVNIIEECLIQICSVIYVKIGYFCHRNIVKLNKCAIYRGLSENTRMPLKCITKF